MIKMRRDGEIGQEQRGGKKGDVSEGWGEKNESLPSTAELSDLVCYQQELSGARAEITRALCTHTYPNTHTEPGVSL